jgi:hypothetical protein
MSDQDRGFVAAERIGAGEFVGLDAEGKLRPMRREINPETLRRAEAEDADRVLDELKNCLFGDPGERGTWRDRPPML